MVSTLGTNAITAVGITTQPKFIGLSPFLALNIAISAIIARKKGENDRDAANHVLMQALLITVGIGIVVTVLMVVFTDPILRFAGTSADTHRSSASFFRIVMGCMIFNIITLLINAAQRGAGNTKIAMTTNMVSNLVNVGLNYLLINGVLFFPVLGVNGSAIATVIGTICACYMSIKSICNKDGFLSIHEMRKYGFRFDKTTLKIMGKIGSTTFSEQIFMRIGMLTVVVMVAKLGTVAFATHQIGMNVLGLTFSFGDGLSVAAITLVGQSLGEKDYAKAKLYGKLCRLLGVGISLVLSVIFLCFGRNIYQLFTKDPRIIDDGMKIMLTMSLIVLIQITQVIYTGCLRGAGDTVFTAIISGIGVTLIRPFFGYLFCYIAGFGLIGVWIGMLFDQFSRFCLTTYRFKRGKWVKIKI